MSQPPEMEQTIKNIRDGLIYTVQDLQEVVQRGNTQLSRCSQSINLVNQALTAVTALQQTNAQLLQENFRLECVINQLKAQVKHSDREYYSKSTAKSVESSEKMIIPSHVDRQKLKSVFNTALQSNIIETDEHGTFSSSPDRFGEICADIVLSVLQGTEFHYNRTFQSLVLSNIRSIESRNTGLDTNKKRTGSASNDTDITMHTGMTALVTTAVAMDKRKKNRKVHTNVSAFESEVYKKTRSSVVRDQCTSMESESDKPKLNTQEGPNTFRGSTLTESEYGNEIGTAPKYERKVGRPRKRATVKEGVKRRKRRLKQEKEDLSVESNEINGNNNDGIGQEITLIEQSTGLNLQQEQNENEITGHDSKENWDRKVLVLPKRAGDTLPEKEYRMAVLDYYSKFAINSLQYAQNNNNLRLRYQVKLRTDRYVSANELLKVLSAEPWRECRKDFPVYQMIDMRKVGPRLGSFLQLNAQLLNDITSLIAHWERQHWIILPKYDDWPDDHPEKLFFANYEKTRDVRHNHLKHKRVQIDSHWRRLISDGEVATGILFDPAYFWITDTRAPWLPTRNNLLVDLIETDYLHPSRTHFTLNPYASSFYHEQLDLIIPPPLADAESLIQVLPSTPPLSEFFTPPKSDVAPQWNKLTAEFSKRCRTQWIELWNLACTQVDANMQAFPRYNQFPREWSSAYASFMLQDQGMILSDMMKFPWFRCAYYDTTASCTLLTPQEPERKESYDLEKLQDLPIEKTTSCHFWPKNSDALRSLLQPYEEHDSL